ncbi:hypothetical protein [Glycomyces arizonensis]|uniref:hypothetical protein n=1 Tax=Glycomyces arizonensis TaxID=256035 RepID=UPI00040F12E3|nr:hypothetical protein [Glycomyces arizonensis]
MWSIDAVGLPLLVPVIGSIALVVRAWIGHRTTKVREAAKTERIRERAKTERLHRLLKDCTPAERARIIRAARRRESPDS